MNTLTESRAAEINRILFAAMGIAGITVAILWSLPCVPY